MKHLVLLACVLSLSFSSLVWGQAAGTASGGSIWGKVSDQTGGVLPGVTVTVDSPSLQGAQTVVTNEQGVYRFPSLPPGDFKVTFTLTGFTTLVRQGIHLTAGFTATVDVQLTVTSVAETVQVVGEAPVVDAVNTRLQTNYPKELLASVPSARDMWAILSTAPAVEMGRIDVGGSMAGTQTAYRAYGINGQTFPLIEGIIGLESSNSVGFYYDYGSFEEVDINSAAKSADIPTPGINSVFISKSGGDTFHGEFYADYESKGLQGHNIDSTMVSKWGLNPESNRVNVNRDLNLGGGGYIVKDKLWWYGSFRHQHIAFNYPQLPTTPFLTTISDYTGKVTYNLPKNNRLIGYVMWGLKKQPYRLDSFLLGNTDYVSSPDSTWNQWNPGWVWKAEWNKSFGNSVFAEARIGQWFDDWHQSGRSDAPRVEDISANIVYGGNRDWLAHQDRPQASGALSYYKDAWHGSHSLKLGWSYQLDDRREWWYNGYPNNTVSVLSNGAPTQVYFVAAKLNSDNRLYWSSVYLTDNWTMSRVSLNVGVRYDRYRSAYPAQSRPDTTYPGDPAIVLPAFSVPGQSLVTWNEFAPRVGLSWDVTNDSRNVVKVFYGRYYWNPTRDIASGVNPNTTTGTPAGQWLRYGWQDLNGNGVWDPGEETVKQAQGGGVANQVLDPTVKDPYTDQVSLSFERQLGAAFGMHVAYIMNRSTRRYQARNTLTPPSVYNIPVTVADPGPDGIVGTADDGPALTFYNLDPSLIGKTLNMTTNVPDYVEGGRTIELAVNRRFANRWSTGASYALTWRNDFNGIPYNPNGQPQSPYVRMTFTKVAVSYEPGWGLRFSPLLRYQSGTPFARRFNVKLNYGTQSVYVEPTGTRRMDAPLLFDCRTERKFQVGHKSSATLLLDAFNIFNSNAVTNENTVSGSSFLLPSSILNPRVFRVGVKFAF